VSRILARGVRVIGGQPQVGLTAAQGLVLELDCPLWQPNINKRSIQKLQRVQNEGLRIVTDSHKRASIDHLHAETQMLTVSQHIDLLSTQYLANSLQHDHPSHAVVTLPPGPRKMKQTLFSKNYDAIRQHFRDNVILTSTYKKVISSFHTSAVSKALCASTRNKVLGEYLPSINPIEDTLVRSHCCALTQLRSRDFYHLQFYQYFINKTDDNLCPECRTASHLTRHLFKCPAFPTNLSVKDLCYQPREVATFFSNLLSFIHNLYPVTPLHLLPIPPEPPP
jgi:hypothetical protein